MMTTRPSSLLATLLLAGAASACAGGPAAPDAPRPLPPERIGERTFEPRPPLAAPPTPLAERRTPDPRNVVHDPALFGGLDWDWIGPARGGRVTAVAGVPWEPGTYYMGSTGGGVFRTSDFGESWQNISDGWFETPSIGAIRVAPSDPDVVWVATGSDGYRSNVITGLGVYRSLDAGSTWRFLGLRDIGNTGAIEIDPRDPNRAYVAAIGHPFGPNPERGVFRTRDGGESWEKVLFISDSTGIVDVEIDPRDPDVVYASSWRGERRPWTIISGGYEGGVYKSTDGGDTWRKLAGGLPEGLIGKIDLAVAASDPRVVYALYEAPEGRDGLYRSGDGGATWEHVSSEDALTGRPFYYINVDVDPTDPNTVWVNNLALWKSTDGGRSWSRVRTPHGDNHDIWIDPGNPDLMVQGNDGGANVSRDGGRTWTSLYNQPQAEMYQVRVDDRTPYWVWGGQQDWDILGVPSLPTHLGAADDFVHYGGGTCETGPAVPKPDDPDRIYNACKGRFMVYDWTTGRLRHYYVGGVFMYGHAARDLPWRFQRVSPVEVSPHDPNTVYHGSQFVHRSRDGGVTWETISPDLTATPAGTQGISGEPITRDITGEEVYSTLYAIEESPLVEGVVWVGSYDGLFHVTRDGGATWTDVTPPTLPAGGRVQAIHASEHDAATAYYAVLRWMHDDWRPWAFRTRDYGRTWTRLTTGDNGIPADYPVRVVREDRVRPGLLYAGAEFGMYVSFDDGGRWQPLQLDLPVTPVTDIALKDDDIVVSTMGRGFWVLRGVQPLRQVSSDIAAARAHLYTPGTATLLDYRPSEGDGAVEPEYPRPGAALDWWLADESAGPVTVELLDDAGRVLNGWTSESGGYALRTVQGMREPETLRVGGLRVPAAAGHTRWVMPLQHPGAWEAASRGEPQGLGGGGPALAPGSYRVRVSAGTWTATAPLRVEMDPNVAAIGVTAAELAEQESLALSVRDLVSRARRLEERVVEEIGKAEAALRRTGETGAAAGVEAGERLRRLREVLALLATAEGIAYPRPMLVDQVGYLYGMVARTPQKPGPDAFLRYETLLAEVTAAEAAVDGAVAAAAPGLVP
ncbi:MAG TPA: hypothetical protein VMM12_00120 [Longimicrobiales bacterium]|nr:hypothetical protein [Longimicrobiales bacterium]